MGHVGQGCVKMTSPTVAKALILKAFHEKLRKPVEQIKSSSLSREDKAKAVNLLVTDAKRQCISTLKSTAEEQQMNSIAVQSCYSVPSLEYRHQVWAYEYMAFSRGVGE